MIIILHSTQLPENLGAVARVMGNFGLQELRLVTPKISKDDPKAIATTAGADDILKNALIFDDLASATQDIEVLYGTCADVRDGIRHYHTPEGAFSNTSPDSKIAVLFGCEKSGLTQEDLSHCTATIQIPVNPGFSSMNLSHAVGIVAYTWFKTQHSPQESFAHLGKTAFATQGEKEDFFNRLTQHLDEVDYWRVASKKPLMQQNLANLFFRMDLTTQELKTLLGMVDILRHPRQ